MASTRSVATALEGAIFRFLSRFSSPHTRLIYRKRLDDFFQFLSQAGKDVHHPREVTERWVLLWHQHLARHPSWSPATKSQHMAALHSFFVFAEAVGIVDTVPTRSLKRPPVSQAGQTPALSPTQVDQALAALEGALARALLKKGPHSRAYRAQRLRFAVVSTLISTGLRVSEVCQIRIENVDLKSPVASLHMTQKGGRPHTVYIHDRTQEILSRYLAESRVGADPGEPLFVKSTPGPRSPGPLHRSTVFRMVRQLAVDIDDCPQSLGPHALRATLATLLHGEGVPLADIGGLLGHRKMETTARYVRSQATKSKDYNPLKNITNE